MTLKSVRWLLLLLLIAGCDGVLDVARSGNVSVRLESDAITIRNDRPAAIYYFAIERTAAAYTDWFPCDDPQTCRHVAARGHLRVPASEVVGWRPFSEVIVYWWHLVPAQDRGFRPDTIRALVVGDR